MFNWEVFFPNVKISKNLKKVKFPLLNFSVYCGGPQSLQTQLVNLIARRRTILRRVIVKNLLSNSDLIPNKILKGKILNKVSNIKPGCVY